MKKVLFVVLLSVFGFSLMACTDSNESYDIVATMYTHYELSKEIVGDEMTVKMLVPIGEGIHGFEASSQDMVDIENAKLFIFTSLEIDTWITDEDNIGGEDTVVLNMSELLEGHDHDAEETTSHQSQLANSSVQEDDHDHSEDAHYWVDPMNAIEIAEQILEAVVEIDPDNASTYTANAEQVIDDITTTVEDFEAEIAALTDLPEIFVAGHNAFSLLGEHFGLHMESIFDEFEPDAVLTSSELIPFVEAVMAENTHYLFVEALEAPTAANAIKDYLEANESYTLTILPLSAYQNVNVEDFNNQVTYLDLLNRNIDNIKLALGI